MRHGFYTVSVKSEYLPLTCISRRILSLWLSDSILQKKKRVVLYVGNSKELASARKVYHKIGFQGLNAPQGQQVKDVERWLEIGFKGATLGYW